MSKSEKESITSSSQRRILTPKELIKIKDLFVVAKGVVEGFTAGHHKSSFKGFSLEFAEYRKYVPGDEIKHIDWKIFARTNKYFVKLFEAETNMRVFIALDSSASMGFKGFAGYSKLEYAKRLAAAFTFLVAKQKDLIGLVTYNEEVVNFIPSRNGLKHTQNIIDRLTNLSPVGKTNIFNSLKSLSDRLKRRSLIVIISDLFDNVESLLRLVKTLRHARHEIMVFHVLDNDEISFPYKRTTDFVDNESSYSLTVDPIALREEYLQAIDVFRNHLKMQLNKYDIPYVFANTLIPFEYVLSQYLSKRKSI